ncbi:class IIb bacteriocin, lactobin A/cerein 7B family [Chryseobacterium carnipullorum]|uniref:class IIb bacteriocin, lactobin A/cerein 7B family n=1 Tax=Chryseobacterium carnipullorum TaxID=1124835 RepID=UPI000E8F2CEC|nr:class IIb bacteriocin, lactobin A/cerein 7B family [Chryseobacterium carnipullorum]HBV16460.1 bacteriocin [Chryseobacterium carnipullorum]
MNLAKLNLVELDTQELRTIDGGFPPVVLAAWAIMAAIDIGLVAVYQNQQNHK